MLLPAGYNQLLVEVSNGQSVEGLQHIHPVGVFWPPRSRRETCARDKTQCMQTYEVCTDCSRV